jgi:hypothetical protein
MSARYCEVCIDHIPTITLTLKAEDIKCPVVPAIIPIQDCDAAPVVCVEKKMELIKED